MRPIFAICTATGVLAVTSLYMWFVSTIPPLRNQAVEAEKATGQFTIEATLTFDAAADSFAFEPVALRIEKAGEPILELTDRVPAGKPILISDMRQIVFLPMPSGLFPATYPIPFERKLGVTEGVNEFYFEAYVGDGDAGGFGDAGFGDGSFENSGFGNDGFNNDPTEPFSFAPRAVRIRILRDGNPIADETLWAEHSDPGEAVKGVVRVTAPKTAAPPKHVH